jgi:DNA-binding response OmpR family regulator
MHYESHPGRPSSPSGQAGLRVLIAEDDEELAGTLAIGLRRENMAVDVALDGTSAAQKVTLTPYDVFVLDRDLPGVHGDEVCRQVVASGASTGSSC